MTTSISNSCCICRTVKNSGKYIDVVLNNMQKIGTLFDKYVIILYYDHSTDDTLSKITSFQNRCNNLNVFSHVILYVTNNVMPAGNIICHINKDPLYDRRTLNIAKGRNWIMSKIRENTVITNILL